MEELIRDIVVLGGGTAGWMSATYLKKAFGDQVNITLIEAASIPKIGVGESTIPNFQAVFFDFLGIPEEEWMRECNAAYKCGVKFVNWRPKGADGKDNHFYHLFGQIPNVDKQPLSHYWNLRQHTSNEKEDLAYSCYFQAPLMDQKFSPRLMDGTKVMSYAWHFDAHFVADYLARLGVKWGVNHVVDEVANVELAEDGKIAAVTVRKGDRYAADLFVDCSGFRGVLLKQALGEPFLDMSDYLFCDSAVATPVPYDSEQQGVEPFTSAIGMKHGWTWKVPMLGRFGTGYVFSSKFVSRDEATDEFLKLWNLNPATTKLNQISFQTGRNRRSWVKNCVSIGLSSAFLEPMEATGIYFIYAALYQLVKHFPDRSFNETLINDFNRAIEVMYDDSRDFIQAHYMMSQRTDTEFWRANRETLTLSDSLKQKIASYKAGMTVNMALDDSNNVYYGNFEAEFRDFWTNSNYYCVLSGLGWLPDQPMPQLRYRPDSIAKAEKVFAGMKEKTAMFREKLPSNYQYLSHLHGRA